MSYTNSYILRAISSILIGLLLVFNPEQMTSILVIVIGVLFALSGCFSLINYMIVSRKKTPTYKPVFPIVGLGSFLFGIFMSVFPDYFIMYLMYVLGLIIILAGMNQLLTSIRFHKMLKNQWYIYLFSFIIMGIGLFIVLKPLESASLPFIIMGYTSIVYGVAEFINGVRIKRAQKHLIIYDVTEDEEETDEDKQAKA